MKPAEWLYAWIKKRYDDDDHVPPPNYLLTTVFIEALNDYEQERNREASQNKNS